MSESQRLIEQRIKKHQEKLARKEASKPTVLKNVKHHPSTGSRVVGSRKGPRKGKKKKRSRKKLEIRGEEIGKNEKLKEGIENQKEEMEVGKNVSKDAAVKRKKLEIVTEVGKKVEEKKQISHTKPSKKVRRSKGMKQLEKGLKSMEKKASQVLETQRKIEKSIKNNIRTLSDHNIKLETTSDEITTKRLKSTESPPVLDKISRIPLVELRDKYGILMKRYEDAKVKIQDLEVQNRSLQSDIQKMKKYHSEIDNAYQNLRNEHNTLVSAYNELAENKKFDVVPDLPRQSLALNNLIVCQEMQSKLLIEFYETEREYVDSLNTIQKYYMDPLLERKLVTHDQFQAIFGQVQVIVNINQMFFSKLDEFMRDTTNEVSWQQFEMFCDAINDVVQSFRLYVPYVSSYGAAIQVLEECRKRQDFVNFLHEATKSLKMAKKRTNTLLGYLIKPIQRIPRYRLLLEGLVKVTKKNPTKGDESVLKRLEQCLSSVCEIADHVNRKNEDVEQQIKLLQLKDIIHMPTLVSPGRKYIDETNQLFRLKKAKHREGVTYLFNDLIVFVPVSKSIFGKSARVSIALDSRTTMEDKSSEHTLIFRRENFDLGFVAETQAIFEEWKNKIAHLLEQGKNFSES